MQLGLGPLSQPAATAHVTVRAHGKNFSPSAGASTGPRASVPGHGGAKPGKAKQASGQPSTAHGHGNTPGHGTNRGGHVGNARGHVAANAPADSGQRETGSTGPSSPSAAQPAGGARTAPLPAQAPQDALLPRSAAGATTTHTPRAAQRDRDAVVDSLPEAPRRFADSTWLLLGVIGAFALGVLAVVVAAGRRGRSH
jgi:hypothetical protein